MKIRLTLQYKVLSFLILPAILVSIVIGYILIQDRSQMIESAKKQANTELEKFASMIQSNIEQDFSIARGIAYSLINFNELKDIETRDELVLKTLNKVIDSNPNYTAFWLSSELQFIDSNFYNKPGRTRYQFYRNESGGIEYKNDSLDFTTNNTFAEGSYQHIKQLRQEILIEPYWFSYTGKTSARILETSVCVPIISNNNFIGLTGSDIKLDKFKEWLDEIDISDGAYMFLISNQGMVISFPNDEMIGQHVNTLFPHLNTKYLIGNHIKSGLPLAFTNIDPFSNSKGFFNIKPLILGKASNPWSIGIFIPQHSIISEANTILFTSIIIAIIAIILALITMVLLTTKFITLPLKSTTSILQKLAKGEISVDKLSNKSGDEIEDMSNSVNQLIDGLMNAANFAKEIGHGKLNADFEKAGDEDTLGISLLEMRKSLIEANDHETKRKKEDEKQNWTTEGLAKFGEILRLNNTNISELTNVLLSNLTDYVDAAQSGLFIRNIQNDNDVVYELVGSIAFDRIKSDEKKFHLGESLVGRCAYEELTIYIEEVPVNYVNITSGLGKSNPRSILLVPAKLNDEVYAVIELVSFNKFDQHQIDFIERLGESIASAISNIKTAESTNRLLEQSKKQSEEIAAQEEEMRQNLEELQATQEEVERLREEEKQKSEKALDEVEKNRTALIKIIDEVPNKVFLKNAECKMVLVNKATLKAMNLELNDVIGKSDLDFLSNEKEAQKSIEEEKEIIKSGKSLTRTHVDMVNNQGVVMETTKIPFYIDYLGETGLLGIQVDITKMMDKEDEIMDLKSKVKELIKKLEEKDS